MIAEYAKQWNQSPDVRSSTASSARLALSRQSRQFSSAGRAVQSSRQQSAELIRQSSNRHLAGVHGH
jgi:hypothetical protein